MRTVVVVIACLLAGWLIGAGLGWASWDPFDDYLWPWLRFFILFVGTPVGLLLAFVAVPFEFALHGRRKRTPGTCPDCGYDLRASPGECPECGRRPAD